MKILLIAAATCFALTGCKGCTTTPPAVDPKPPVVVVPEVKPEVPTTDVKPATPEVKPTEPTTPPVNEDQEKK